MQSCSPIPVETLDRLPPHARDPREALREALQGLGRRIVVLDDDPTGVQTVHGVTVYTRWDRETLLEAFRAPERMFFVLTNSRALTEAGTRALHAGIAEDLAAVAAETGEDFLLLSRSDSTLRGHWPLETEVLRQGLEAAGLPPFDGELILPFFPEGGRYTLGGVHYVRQGGMLVPAGQTEFAADRSFGFTASALPDWCEEKSGGRYSAESCCRVSLEELRAGDAASVAKKLEAVTGFRKICADCADYGDLAVLVTALCMALNAGKRFLFRCAAALPKVLGGIEDRPLLEGRELVDPGNPNGGILLVGSHVGRTSRQLEVLRGGGLPLEFIPFDQHRVLEEGGLEDELRQVLARCEDTLRTGRSAAVFTRRERIDAPGGDADEQLRISAQISDALIRVIGELTVRPSFVAAKGGITSSDVGTRALHVRRALVMGQIRPGVPVWQTGPESKFPGLPYVIFPGNVGAEDDLLRVMRTLIEA